MKFRDRFANWMSGRNGMDELARFESGLVLVLLIISLFSRLGLLYIVALAVMIHMYYRMFSRNVSKRYEENQKFLNLRYNSTVEWNKKKKHFAQRKTYCFFKCPQCKQEVRVPRGHGKICITCPRCRTEFIKRT
ncbi:hypothetical protein FYJ75_04390 [Roseburia sp. MUC/MUC-530-WT-4D]|uniref:Zn-finger containing protein n=1 Tax=Roseburia porci TaxID=2605790 RepID=A0A6L5YQ29_9FIRM|nr:hypothetical protein [Roseburia porci]MCI5516948.1 hypothetical protein [Roseburia sp.]MDD6742284.1 hypothetical protein [Roseburia porci]MST74277.1 hypothetical protein [Roseburia porci]